MEAISLFPWTAEYTNAGEDYNDDTDEGGNEKMTNGIEAKISAKSTFQR